MRSCCHQGLKENYEPEEVLGNFPTPCLTLSTGNPFIGFCLSVCSGLWFRNVGVLKNTLLSSLFCWCSATPIPRGQVPNLDCSVSYTDRHGRGLLDF